MDNKLTTKKVAVLLASHNGEKFIKDQINSILNQENVNVEIFVSDDGSTDATLNILNSMSRKTPNINLINTTLIFKSATLNFFNLILNNYDQDYDYFAFADQDDIWLPKKLKRAISILDNSKSDGFSSNITSWWEDSDTKKKIYYDQKHTNYDYMFQSPGPGCTFVLKRKSFFELRTFISKLDSKVKSKIWFHDWFIYAYFRKMNFSWFIDNQSNILYRQHSNNVMGINKGINALKKRFDLIINKDYRKQIEFLSQTLGYEKNLPIIKNSYLGLSIITNPLKSRRKMSHSFGLFIMSILKLF